MEKTEKINKIIKKDCPYTVEKNALFFLEGNRIPSIEMERSLLGKVKAFLKNYGRIYYLLISLFSPVKLSLAYRQTCGQLLAQYTDEHIILNVGSGPHNFCGRKDIINIDIYAFDKVDIIADATHLPIEADSVDFVVATALLEHVEHPEKAIGEMYRILRPGGSFLCYMPFIVPFHEAPNDFFRWTAQGCQKAFNNFSNVRIDIGVGPTGGMLWVFQEWFATAFSFGIRKLHDILFILIMVVTSPMKFFDVILEKFPTAEIISSGHFVSGNKQTVS
ncbi:methyltransferase domain-containing protein [Thermodesulfobacteriota bacterium]